MSQSTTRRRFLAATAAFSAAAACSREPSARPNILWIIAEDFSPDLGCYGNKLVHTPNIDRLASEGMRYTNACVTAPICSIARSALMTGMYQTAIGAHNHRSHRDDDYRLPGGIFPFPALFTRAGYHTSNLEDTPVGGTGKTDLNFNLDAGPFEGTDWTERSKGQSFYAQINFSETHRAFKNDIHHPIDPQAVELPPYYPDHPVVREEWALYLETAQHLDRKVGAVLDRLEEQGLADDTIVFFFSDHGRPMPRAKQFCYDPGMLIPLIIRIPEKFRPEGWTPGAVDEQLVSHIDLTATSLALAGIERPAYMQARVFLGPERDEPRDVLFCARDRADETVDRIRAARTKKWKYIRNFYPERPYLQRNHYKDTSYPTLQVLKQLHEKGRLDVAQGLFLSARRPEEELYDLESDPFEIRNLAGASEHQEILEDLRADLLAWLDETGDTGAEPEPQLPREYDFRTEADGWATSSGFLSKQEGRLKMEWSGDENKVTRPWVVDGGEFFLEIVGRADGIAPKELFWGTVENVRGRGNRAPIEFANDGRWRTLRIPFTAPGWLVNFGLDFGAGEGRFELDRALLFRNEKVVGEWDFL